VEPTYIGRGVSHVLASNDKLESQNSCGEKLYKLQDMNAKVVNGCRRKYWYILLGTKFC
jgi:hypothetical protein